MITDKNDVEIKPGDKLTELVDTYGREVAQYISYTVASEDDGVLVAVNNAGFSKVYLDEKNAKRFIHAE